MQLPVGVLSEDGELLELLRRECPEWDFLTGEAAESARVVVLDRVPGDRADALRKAIVRIVLTSEPQSAVRRPGEMRLGRETFAAAPGEYLAVASEFAETVVHATQLELEVGYLMQSQELVAMLDAEAVSERVARSILNILGLPHAVLLLHDPRIERYAVSFSNDENYLETSEFLGGVPPDLLQRAFSTNEVFAIDERRGLIVVPLQDQDDLVGIVRISTPAGYAVDDAARLQLRRYVTAVQRVLGNVYMQTRSRDLAMRDDLTKAFNRRFFESYLDEELERSRRYGVVFSIIFLDLDDLKSINARHGHLTGSRTLQEVAKRILGAVRGIDKVVRFGGDEFCVILPQTDCDQALAVANRIRKAMQSGPLRIEEDVVVNVTASFGIATYPSHAITKEGLIRRADEAMYRVKSSTKNAIGIAVVDDATRPAVL